MNISVSATQFSKLLNVANSVGPETIRLVFSGPTETLKIHARSMYSGFFASMPLIVKDFPDEVLIWDVAAAPFMAWINNMPRDDYYYFRTEKDRRKNSAGRVRLVIESGGSKTRMNEYQATALYPKLPTDADEEICVVRSGLITSVFSPALALAKAKAKDHAIGVLQFLALDITEKELILLATDSNAAIMAKIPANTKSPTRVFPAPQSVAPLAQYISTDFSSATIYLISNFVFFVLKDVTFYFVNNQVNYPVDKLKEFFSERQRAVAVAVNSADLTNSIRGAEGVARWNNQFYPKITLECELDSDLNKFLSISSTAEEIGDANSKLPITGTAPVGNSISLSTKYAKLAVSAINTETTEIHWGDPKDWVLVNGKPHSGTMFLIAPII